ncbi:response regulator transcription factor [Pseudomonas fluorescens]|uniref:response regulator transcription factor n=1 Tax=Pseudomonas fluorescens TaxID=294 RepID=UPI0020357E0E|nr:helix-turn-helix transcriptional regulator [Pseudomonas fluorescens]
MTKREHEVVSLIGQGLDCRRIAEALGIAYFTVRKHRSNILYKLLLNSAAQLAAYAVLATAPSILQDRVSDPPGLP